MTRILRLSDEEWNALRNKHRKPREVTSPRPTQKEHVDGWPIVLRDQIVEAGLPEPYREHMFHGSRGWRCDLAWPERKCAVEVDGGVHRIKGRFLADIERHNALTLAGWRYMRVTSAMVRDGSALELVKAFLE